MKKLLMVLLVLLVIGVIYYFYNVQSYEAEYFGIEKIQSLVDYDSDGIDDYTDLVIGAKKDADNHPRYDGAYMSGGYPSDNVGVCTDVIWRAFKEAGYNLKEMVDKDISLHPMDYPHIINADPNIDFRRVPNLHIFFKKYGTELTLDKSDISAWQPGDIVIFGNDNHIGLVSDKRSRSGYAMIYHNAGQLHRHENYLSRGKVIGHFRFDAEKIDENVLISW